MSTAAPNNIDEAIDALRSLRAASVRRADKGWSVAQALRHCTLSVRYSMSGFPRLKSGFVRATIGKLVAGRFLKRGRMGHSVTSEIPGEPAFTEDLSDEAAIDELIEALRHFEGFSTPLQPHFIFGDLTKDEFARMHVMHIADHLAVIHTD